MLIVLLSCGVYGNASSGWECELLVGEECVRVEVSAGDGW